MADQEQQSDLEQQQDPRGDLLKARPGGDTDIGSNPNTDFRDQKPESGHSGSGSDGGYQGGPDDSGKTGISDVDGGAERGGNS